MGESLLVDKVTWGKGRKEYDLNSFIPRDKVIPKAEKKEKPRGHGALSGE
jgi:hypothetical protein